MPSFDAIPGMSYEVMERIKRERQLGLDDRDCSYRPLQIVSGYSPRLFVADVDESDTDGPEDWRLTGQAIHRGRVIHTDVRKR